VQEEKEQGTFLMVNVAAQRARQLMQGAPSLIKTTSRKPAAIAIREVDEGLIPFYMPEEVLPSEEEVADEPQETEPTE
jgi:DNA-directed RNA polymerase omega subunit